MTGSKTCAGTLCYPGTGEWACSLQRWHQGPHHDKVNGIQWSDDNPDGWWRDHCHHEGKRRMANITAIPNSDKAALVDMLKEALEEAERGEWHGVAMILFERLPNGHIGSEVLWSGAMSFHEKLGLIHDMADRMSASRKQTPE